MLQHMPVIALPILLISLTYFGLASSTGPETPTTSLDQIQSEVAGSLDLGNSNVEQTAVTIAKDYPGEYNMNQVCEIFNTLRKGWYYFSDPSYKNKYKNANRTLQDGKISSTIGMGNCDDFAILMASLIASLGGSTRITFASNMSSTEGHAYCEVFLGNKSDSQVDELINWTKSEYNLSEVPGLNTTDNEVWMNLDWWADNPGGPYFEGDEKMVVWQSDKLVSPKIVPIIDTMDSTAGWETLKDSKGSNISISSYPARKGLGIGISYDLKQGGWVGISRNVDPEVLYQVEGLNFSALEPDEQSTIELRLAYNNGTEFGYSWEPALGKWVYLQALYKDFKCGGLGNNSSSPNNKLDPESIEKLEFIVSSQPGDQAGSGKVVIDHVQGVMNVPAGSPWARMEDQRKEAAALDLASKSEMMSGSSGESLIQSTVLALDSLKNKETVSGKQALRNGLALLPFPCFGIFHSNNVFKVSFSPDSKRIATASSDNTSLVYDIGKAKRLWRFNHSGWVTDVIFSPNGKMVATASKDNTARIWDLGNGSEIRRFVHNGSVNSVAFSPGGDMLATASRDNTSRIWDVKTGSELYQMNHDGPVSIVVFSPDGSKVATASEDRTARIWDVKTGRELRRLYHNNSVTDVIFDPEVKRIATSSLDKTARIWDVEKGIELVRLNHVNWVWSISFSPEGKRVATSCECLSARIWDAKDGRELSLWPTWPPGGGLNHDDSIYSINFNPDGNFEEKEDYDTQYKSWVQKGTVVTSSLDNTSRVWDAQTGKELMRIVHNSTVNYAVFSPDGQYIATASKDGTARIWRSKTGIEPTKIPVGNYLDSIAFTPKGDRIVTTSHFSAPKQPLMEWNSSTGEAIDGLNYEYVTFSSDGRLIAAREGNAVKIIDSDTLKELVYLNHSGWIYGETPFSNNGKLLAISGDNITIWDTDSGKEISKICPASSIRGSPILTLTFSPEGERLATINYDNSISVWDLVSGKELVHKNQGNKTCTWINPIRFSPDGKKLATVFDNCAKIWDAGSGRLMSTLNHSNYVYDVAFSPNGTLIATAGYEGTVKIWNPDSGKELMRLKHTSVVNAVTFNPDGKYIATASCDATARVWDVQTGKELDRLVHDDCVIGATFSRDSKLLATTEGSSNVRIWRLSYGDLMREAYISLNNTRESNMD